MARPITSSLRFQNPIGTWVAVGCALLLVSFTAQADDNLLSIAVYPPRAADNIKVIAQEHRLDARQLSAVLQERLRETGRFRVLERDQDILNDADEERLVSGPAANPRDSADLVAVVSLTKLRLSRKEQSSEMLPGRVTHLLAGELEATIKLIEPGRGEIKFMKSVHENGEIRRAGSAAPAEDMWAFLAKATAKTISEAIADRAYPIRVVAIEGEIVVLNWGMPRVQKGAKVQIYSSGTAVADPDTGRNLGNIEIPLGEFIITHSTDKLSNAQALGTMKAAPRPGDIARTLPR